MLINKIHICSELCKKIKVKLNMKKVIENTNQDKRQKNSQYWNTRKHKRTVQFCSAVCKHNEFFIPPQT